MPRPQDKTSNIVLSDDFIARNFELLESYQTDNKYIGDIVRLSKKRLPTFTSMGMRIAKRYFKSFSWNLLSLLEELPKLDKMVSLIQKRHRDHYRHVIRVGVMGEFFLNCYLVHEGYGKTLHEAIGSFSDEPEFYKNFIKSWWLVALLHDHGYILESIWQTVLNGTIPHFSKSLLKILFPMKFNSDDPFEQTTSFAESVLGPIVKYTIHEVPKLTIHRNYLAQIQEEQNEITSRKKVGINHGLLSAFNFLKLSEDLPSDICDRPNVGYAIAVHDLEDIEVDFFEQPLAYLLVLLDSIQEWNRTIRVLDENSDYEETLVTDLDKVKLAGLADSNAPAGFTIGKTIKFIFDYSKRADALSKTGFDEEKYQRGKEREIRRLKPNEIIRKISFKMNFPDGNEEIDNLTQ